MSKVPCDIRLCFLLHITPSTVRINAPDSELNLTMWQNNSIPLVSLKYTSSVYFMPLHCKRHFLSAQNNPQRSFKLLDLFSSAACVHLLWHKVRRWFQVSPEALKRQDSAVKPHRGRRAVVPECPPRIWHFSVQRSPFSSCPRCIVVSEILQPPQKSIRFISSPKRRHNFLIKCCPIANQINVLTLMIFHLRNRKGTQNFKYSVIFFTVIFRKVQRCSLWVFLH